MKIPRARIGDKASELAFSKYEYLHILFFSKIKNEEQK